jgi:hypothetical protein
MRLRISIAGAFLSSVLALAILVSGAAAKDDEIENLLSNPDFEKGLNGWSIGAEGVLSLVEKGDKPPGLEDYNGMLATINAVGADAWVPEIHSPAFDVEMGEQYTVDFWAKTEPECVRELGIKFEQLDTWTGPATTINLTDEWQHFVYSPVMTMDSPPQVVIHIQFNFMLEDVWFMHFRVYQGEYVEEDLEGLPPRAVTSRDKLATAWGSIKSK